MIISIGLPRTGTTSISNALEYSGMNIFHGISLASKFNNDDVIFWEQCLNNNFTNVIPYFNKYDICFDIPMLCFLDEFITIFKLNDVKLQIVYTHRSMEEWVKSWQNYMQLSLNACSDDYKKIGLNSIMLDIFERIRKKPLNNISKLSFQDTIYNSDNAKQLYIDWYKYVKTKTTIKITTEWKSLYQLNWNINNIKPNFPHLNSSNDIIAKTRLKKVWKL